MTDTTTDREADGQVGRIRIHGVDYYDEYFCRALLARAEAAEAEKDAAVMAERQWADTFSETLMAMTAKHGGRNAARLIKDYRDHRARSNKGGG